MKAFISFPLVYCTSFVQYELGIISKKNYPNLVVSNTISIFAISNHKRHCI